MNTGTVPAYASTSVRNTLPVREKKIMKRLILLIPFIAYQAFAAYVVDVTFNGDTNNFSTVEINNGKGLKEFDTFLESQESGKTGLGEQIIISDFKVTDGMPGLSIQGQSNQLKGYKTAKVKGKREKHPVIRATCFSIDIKAWYPGTWLTVGGGVSNGTEEPVPAMIRIRKINSGKEAKAGNKVSHTDKKTQQQKNKRKQTGVKK